MLNPSLNTKDDVMQFIKDNDVKFIRLQFTDIFGHMKNIAITHTQLEKAFTEGIMFDASSVAGFLEVEKSDLFLFPDPSTFTLMPWRPQHGKVARVICDIRHYDGSQFEADSRYILKKVISRAGSMGLELNVGIACEFFLFHTDAEGRPTTLTHDRAGYFDLAPIDLGENTRREICMVLEDMGFEVEASHHEAGFGQHEIDFRYSDALSSADNILTFKMVVRTIAQRNGLHATFMPKPFIDRSGSGMHINMSLHKDGKNIFATDEEQLDISDEAKSFIAGILAHIKGMTAITNPTINSYKRFMPDFHAPMHLSWSYMNRSSLIRIPAVKNTSKRIELRSPDPTCNPYLSLALILSAGLDGIEQNLNAPLPISHNAFHTQDAEFAMDTLPSTLHEALLAMQQDSFIESILGEHIYQQYVSSKEQEWRNYNNVIHPWELDNYLGIY